jgi:hypothetical protein
VRLIINPSARGIAVNASRETVTALRYTKNRSLAEAQLPAVEVRDLFRSLRHEFDPLDLEILERALDAAWAAVKDNSNDPPADFDSDEGLETILKRELIETARFNGVSDPETLRDLLLSRLGAGCCA